MAPQVTNHVNTSAHYGLSSHYDSTIQPGLKSKGFSSVDTLNSYIVLEKKGDNKAGIGKTKAADQASQSPGFFGSIWNGITSVFKFIFCCGGESKEAAPAEKAKADKEEKVSSKKVDKELTKFSKEAAKSKGNDEKLKAAYEKLSPKARERLEKQEQKNKATDLSNAAKAAVKKQK